MNCETIRLSLRLFIKLVIKMNVTGGFMHDLLTDDNLNQMSDEIRALIEHYQS